MSKHESPAPFTINGLDPETAFSFLPGVRSDLTDEAYHSGPGISKSGLWKLYSKTPAHFIGETVEQTEAMKFGSAVHIALLQPELLESRYAVVPEGAPNRPSSRQINAKNPSPETVAAINWWGQWQAANSGRETISAEDYAAIIQIRDKLHADPLIKRALSGAQFEHSAYWMDEETGVLCRCRPDAYNPDLGLMLDLKTTASASPADFSKSVANFGYHVQEAFYSDGWQAAGGGPVEGFVFIAVEKNAPYAFALYELEPEDVEHGRAIYREALNRYADCKRSNSWPAYAPGVQPLTLPAWAKPKPSYTTLA